MIPKLENALAAIDAGVKEVIITLATAIDGKHGTQVDQNWKKTGIMVINSHYNA